MLNPLRGSDKLQQILDTDPLVRAEEVTKKSYKEDEETKSLGLGIAFIHNGVKNAILEAAGDTTLSMEIGPYITAITGIGFQEVFREEFCSAGSKVPDECLYMFYRKPGQLLVFDTFGTHRNGGNLYYNWVPDGAFSFKTVSSGHFSFLHEEDKAEEQRLHMVEMQIDDWGSPERTAAGDAKREFFAKAKADGRLVWVGYHDSREALLHNLERLEAEGHFIEPWAEQPFLWLLNYQDTKDEGYDYSKINARRIAQLPAHVQEMIGEYKQKDDE